MIDLNKMFLGMNKEGISMYYESLDGFFFFRFEI